MQLTDSHILSMHLKEPSSASLGLQGVFDAMADAAKAKSFAADDDEPSASTFGTTLFSEVCGSSSENCLISPLSVEKALALVKAGATIGSENEAEIASVLGPPFLIEQADEEDNGDSDVQLLVATSLWANELKESFVEKAISEHSAEALPLPTYYTPIGELYFRHNKLLMMI